MRLAAPTAAQAPSVDLTLRPGMSSAELDRLLATAEPSPTRELLRASSKDFLSLQGLTRLGWSSRTPDDIELEFATEGFRRLADNVLRDTVEGTRLVLASRTPGGVPSDDIWADSVAMMLQSVRAMPGVLSSMTWYEHGKWDAFVKCADEPTSARLKRIVNPMLGNHQVIWNPWPQG